MGDSRWVGAGLLTAFLSVGGACVNQDDSCGGPTSDFPFCDDDRGPDDGEGASGDNGGGGGKDPVTSPPATDGGAGDAGTCEPALPIACEGVITPLEVQGQCHLGPVTVTGVALMYSVSAAPEPGMGLRYAASFDFTALIAGERAVIRAAAGYLSKPGAATRPGSYGWGAPDPDAHASAFSSCPEPALELRAGITIHEHAPVSLAPGGSGVLRGELRLLEPGWDLTVPFEIHQACRETAAAPSDLVDAGT